MRPVLLLPEELLPEDLLLDDLLPEDLVELLLVVLLVVDLDELLLFRALLSREELFLVVLLLVLLLLVLPLSLFPESFFVRADEPERVEVFLLLVDDLVDDLLRSVVVLRLSLRVRRRFSILDSVLLLRSVLRRLVDLVPAVPRSYLLAPLSVFRASSPPARRPDLVEDFVEVRFVVLALRVAP